MATSFVLSAALVKLARARTLGDVAISGVTEEDIDSTKSLGSAEVLAALAKAGVRGARGSAGSFALRLSALSKRVPSKALSMMIEDADFDQLSRDVDMAELAQLGPSFTEGEAEEGGTGSDAVVMAANPQELLAPASPAGMAAESSEGPRFGMPIAPAQPVAAQGADVNPFASFAPALAPAAAATPAPAMPVGQRMRMTVEPPRRQASGAQPAPPMPRQAPANPAPPAAAPAQAPALAAAPAPPLGQQIGMNPDGTHYYYMPADFLSLRDLLATVLKIIDDPAFAARVTQGPLAGQSAEVVAAMVAQALELATTGPKGVGGAQLKAVADAGFNNRKWMVFCLSLLSASLDATAVQPTVADVLRARYPLCEMMVAYKDLWPYCNDKLQEAQRTVAESRNEQFANLKVAAEIAKMTKKP